MHNLLRMHLNTIFKRKHIYVIGLILLVLPTLTGMMTKAVAPHSYQESVTADMNNMMLAMMVAYLAAIYYCRMISTGFIKNVACAVKKKSSIFFSVLVTFLILDVIYTILSIAGEIIADNVLFKQVIPVGNFNNIIIFFFISLLMAAAVIGIGLAVAVVSRSAIVTMIALTFMQFIVMKAINMIDSALHVSLTKYTLFTTYTQLSYNNASSWGPAEISAIIVIVISIFVSVWWLDNRDMI